MALTDATLTSMGNHLASLAPYISLHSASPGTTGANEVAITRKSVTWVVDADGDLTLSSPVQFDLGPVNGPVHSVGLWSAASGGTFRGSFTLSGDSTFNANGDYLVNSITINGTSS